MPGQGAITYNQETLPDGVLLAVAGDIDFGTSPGFRSQISELAAGAPSRLVVDLTGVDYMDSSGVATLVEALQGQRHRGGRLVLCGLQPKVQGIFDIARLNTVFLITPDVRSARTI